ADFTTESDFFDVGGDSFAAMEFVVQAEGRGMYFVPSILQDCSTIQKLCDRLKHDHFSEALGKEELMSHVQAELKAMQSRLSLSWSKAAEHSVDSCILLTGATGFFGSELLKRLLDLTSFSGRIICIVRARDDSHAMERVKNALKRVGVTNYEQVKNRLIVVSGDLSEDYLGLSLKNYRRIGRLTAKIIHGAAEVNLFKDLSNLYASNVIATRQLLAFALENHIKQFDFISTLSVFVASDRNRGSFFEDDALTHTKHMFGGYAQSKWIAEVLVRNVQAPKLTRRIYRLGLITGDSSSGHSAGHDYLKEFIQGVTEIGSVPRSALDLAVDVTPVDYAADALVRISMQKTTNGLSCFHIANSRGATLHEIREALRVSGVEVALLDAHEWQEKFSQIGSYSRSQLSAKLALCAACDSERTFASKRTFDLFQATDTNFDCSSTKATLKRFGMACPQVSQELLMKYVSAAIVDDRRSVT
ncbi:MAG: thioester reductase domain-containing protein, partial [Bdellovibrionales bacterium]|nr:thioester reductase domain-containing protein [Bdellovibrionales bacterium]